MNELFALHLDGKLLEPNVWAKYSKKYGDNYIPGWKPPKKVYYKRGHAKSAITHLPEEIKDEVEIVRYIPEDE